MSKDKKTIIKEIKTMLVALTDMAEENYADPQLYKALVVLCEQYNALPDEKELTTGDYHHGQQAD